MYVAKKASNMLIGIAKIKYPMELLLNLLQLTT